MATTYNHIRMSEVDASANVRVMYPETTAADVTVSRTNNTNIPSTATTMQLLADKLVASAFAVPIDDSSTTSTTKSWSAKKINTAVTNISTYVGTDGKIHFKNSAGTDTALAFNKASGTAAAAQVLTGYTFSNDSGSGISGSMANNGAVSKTINPGGSYTIPTGYHNGSGKVTANANQNSGTYKPTTRAASIDMGAHNTMRYVNTTSVPNSCTTTYTPTTRKENIDMGATNSYRYVTTTSVPNSCTATYTVSAREKKDLGATNNYRYIDSSGMKNVNSGTYKPTTRAASIDMGAENSYRYVTTTSVPNSCTATYTLAATEKTKNLGASHNYRYINATNVYNQGKTDGVTTHTLTYTLKWDSDFGTTKDMGTNHTYRYIKVPAKPSTSKSITVEWNAQETGGDGVVYINVAGQVLVNERYAGTVNNCPNHSGTRTITV